LDYLLSFIEGIITFISPCLLPMLPVYVSYFAGGEIKDEKGQRRQTLINALGFVMGFTIVFLLLGAAAGTFGKLVQQNETVFNIIGGLILVLFGLNFMSVIQIGFLNRTLRFNMQAKKFNFFSSAVLGFVFSIGWTPCVGAFLGSALMLAASSQEAVKGIVMLLLFSLGLGIPFLISAVLINSLKTTFDAIKRHYKIINIISGLLLILVGIFMMSGKMNEFASFLTF